jgi:hypothetical protein
LVIALWGAALGGCSKTAAVDGTYKDETGMMLFRFHRGTLDLTVGLTRSFPFELSGNTVTVMGSGRRWMVLTKQPDGTLVGDNIKLARVP